MDAGVDLLSKTKVKINLKANHNYNDYYRDQNLVVKDQS